MQGFVPADEVLWFRPKDPKPCTPSMFNSLRRKSFEWGSSLDLLSAPLSLVWQGARTAHTSLYGKDEQCRQTGWIDAQTREVILARTLRDESTDLSSSGLGLLCGRPGYWQGFENGGWYPTDFPFRVHCHKRCGAFYHQALTLLFTNGV